MLRTERWEEPANAIGAAMEGKQSEIWTAIPGIVDSFNAEHNTVEVQPTIQRRVRRADGKWINETLSLCVDVPVHFPSGGGFSLTVPVKRGDEVLLVFSARCIDGWWEKGGVQPQQTPRMHNRSDGFAILGTRSKAKALKNVSTTTVQLRSDDGKTFIEIDSHQTVRIVAPTKVRLETPLLEVTGKINAGDDVYTAASVKAHNDVQANVDAIGASVSVGATASPHDGVDPTDISPTQIMTVATQVAHGLTTGDLFTVSGAAALNAVGQLIPGASGIINAVHQVQSVLSGNAVTAIISRIPGLSSIAGNPTLGAIVHLLTHDHHGVRSGSDISSLPVKGT